MWYSHRNAFSLCDLDLERLSRLLSLLVIVLCLPGCSEHKSLQQERKAKANDTSGHLGSTLVLTDDELKQTEVLAAKGDGDAAYILHLHYEFGLQDPEKGTQWLNRAAELGCPEATDALSIIGED